MDLLIKELLNDLEAANPAAARKFIESLPTVTNPPDLVPALYKLMTSGLIDRTLLMQLLERCAQADVMEPETFSNALTEAEHLTGSNLLKVHGKGIGWWN